MMKRIVIAFLILSICAGMISCGREAALNTDEDIQSTTGDETSKAPQVSTKKHKSIDEYNNESKEGLSPMYDGKNIDPKKIPYKNDLENLSAAVKNMAGSYKAEDEGKILFYGHSHYTRWSTKFDAKPLEECIPGTLNHGFGSSTMHDLALNYEKLVKPWKPKALVITSFANDYNYEVYEIIQLTDWLLNKVTKDFPDMKVFITDYTPILKDRSGVMDRLKELNEQLKKCADQYENVTLIEMSKEPGFYMDAASVGTYNNVRPELYVSDQTHFTAAGFEVVTEIYKRVLKDLL